MSHFSKFKVYLSLSLFLCTSLQWLISAPIITPLNSHIIYLRLHRLPNDLPAQLEALNKVCILDLRNLKSRDEDAQKLNAWVLNQASLKTPVLILQNEETSYSLVSPYTPTHTKTIGVITLGPTVSRFPPDIQVDVSSESDQQGYKAFETGTSLELLITPKIDKVRDDEERLNKEHVTDSSQPLEPEVKENHLSTVVTDPVLQRAFHLVEGLVALKRIN